MYIKVLFSALFKFPPENSTAVRGAGRARTDDADGNKRRGGNAEQESRALRSVSRPLRTSSPRPTVSAGAFSYAPTL